jgi:hypothetical protein
MTMRIRSEVRLYSEKGEVSVDSKSEKEMAIDGQVLTGRREI